jgi:GNAT superfamily N-acetyltransferase
MLRVARLAVDRSVQGQGLGGELLRFVLQIARRMATDYGCVGVVVDAKTDAIDFYAKYGFVPLEVVHGQSEVRPRPTAMFLSTRTIRSAAAR